MVWEFLDDPYYVERKGNLSTDAEGTQILYRGREVPGYALPDLFRSCYQTLIIAPTGSKTFVFTVEGNKYSYEISPEGEMKFCLNDEPHSFSGSPSVVEPDGTAKYYNRGTLHRDNGPAVINSSGHTEFYLLGKKISIFDFIRSTPEAFCIKGVKGNRTYKVYKWREYVLLEGAEGSSLLLEKSEEQQNEYTNLLFSTIARKINGYKLKQVEKLSSFAQEIKSDFSKSGWSCIEDFPSNAKFISTEQKLVANFDKAKKNLSIEGQDGKVVRRFDLNNYRVYKYDQSQRFHSEEGPALVDAIQKVNRYFLHGVEITKKRLQSKLKDQSGYYWVNKQNQLHTSNSVLPSCIYFDGSKEYHYKGLLHNEGKAAVSSHGDNWYYLFGNEVSFDEFMRYNSHSKSISFWKNSVLHRADGPALITFNEDGYFVKRYFKQGVAHNDYGPAVYAKDGSYEYKKEGRLHNEVGPALVSKSKKLTSYYSHGLLHSDDGPAVIKCDKDQTLYEFWSQGLLQKIYAKTRGHSFLVFERPPPEGEKMKNNNYGDTRKSQLSNGMGSGLKKGALRVTSRTVAKKLTADFSDSKAVERLAQLGVLIGTAEIFERLPGSMMGKVKISEDHQQRFGKLSRDLSGEILGRDAVDLVVEHAPALVDALSELSVEDMEQLASIDEDEDDLDVPSITLTEKESTVEVTQTK